MEREKHRPVLDPIEVQPTRPIHSEPRGETSIVGKEGPLAVIGGSSDICKTMNSNSDGSAGCGMISLDAWTHLLVGCR
jgi:hypothetical protein